MDPFVIKLCMQAFWASARCLQQTALDGQVVSFTDKMNAKRGRGSGLSIINDLFQWNVMTQSFYRSITRVRTFYIHDTVVTKLSP